MSGSAASGASNPTPLAQLLHGSAPPAKKPRACRRRNTEEAVDKIMKEQFGSFTAAQQSEKLVAGMSLRDMLLADKRKQKKDKKDAPVMGKNYYATMRSKFEDQGSNPQALKALDTNQALDPRLVKAMAASQSATQNKGLMQQFLMVVQNVNQRELVGILKFFQQLRPSSSAEQLRCGLDVLAFMNRLSIPKSYEKEHAAVVDNVDQVLCQAG